MEAFSCKRCGECCRNFSVALDIQTEERIIFHLEDRVSMALWEWEAERLRSESERLGIGFSLKPVTFFYDKLSETPILTSWTMKHEDCPFLSGTACNIYEKRPLACRMFPLVKSGVFDFLAGRSISLPKSACKNNAIEGIIENGSIQISEYIMKMSGYYGNTFLAAVQSDMIKFYIASEIKKFAEKNMARPLISPKHLAITRYHKRKPLTFFEFLIAAGAETSESIGKKTEMFDSLEEARGLLERLQKRQ